MMPPESALLLRAAAALVPADQRVDWRREWEAELWWWLSSSPDPSRPALAHHCVGAVIDAFWLRAGEDFDVRSLLGRPASRLAIAALALALVAAFSGGFRHTRRALLENASGRLAILTETGPFMGQIMPLPPARVAQWSARSRTLESITLVNRGTALCRLNPGVTAAQAEAELRAWNGFLHITPYAYTVYRPIAVLGPAFLALVLLALVHWLCSATSHPFPLAQSLAWLAALFLGTLELPGSPAALFLPYLIASFLALRFCWRDQRQRCPVCLQRLALPVRIGLGPRSPFEPEGTEFLCPSGHGVLFTSGEAEPESRWSPLVA